GLASTLEAVDSIRTSLSGLRANALAANVVTLDSLPAARERILRTLTDEPPLSTRAGGVIRNGFDPRVDELRGFAHHGKKNISEMESAERQRTGINSLKIRYTQAFG